MPKQRHDILAARHEQTRKHNAIVRRHLPTLLRVDTSNVDPIVEVWHYSNPNGVICSWTDKEWIGSYQRRGYGDDEPWNPVYTGDASPLFTDGANLVRCDETGAI